MTNLGSSADADTQPGKSESYAHLLTAADVGFQSDAEFLGYVHAHSQTERALFNNVQIAFAMQLAGQPKGRVDECRAAQGLWRSVDMRDLVEDARAAIVKATTGNSVGTAEAVNPENPLSDKLGGES